MGNLRNISALALAGLLVAGCVSHQTAKLDAAHALADRSSLANAPAARTAGVASATAGDNWTAANLFEQARAGNNSPLNRFNLASSYEATGRSAQAAVLYRSVVPDGHYLKVTTNRMNDNQKGISRRVNLSEESLRRALVIEAQLRKGGPAAVDLGAPVSESATVGGPKRGVVSDARALNLDEKAEVKQDAKEDAARPQ